MKRILVRRHMCRNADMVDHVCMILYMFAEIPWGSLASMRCLELSWHVWTSDPESLARRRHKVSLSLLSAAIEIGALSAKHQNLFPRDSRRMCELVV